MLVDQVTTIQEENHREIEQDDGNYQKMKTMHAPCRINPCLKLKEQPRPNSLPRQIDIDSLFNLTRDTRRNSDEGFTKDQKLNNNTGNEPQERTPGQ
jgi:hypothetical protein